jgi:hypothetical protein
MKPQWIVCAAMLMDDDLIVPGNRHYSPSMRILLHRIYGKGYHKRVKEQGFIDDRGNFLGRSAALAIAIANGQVKYDVSHSKILFSENLY